MIPSLSSLLLPGNYVSPSSPAAPELASMPLVPTFMLGSNLPAPHPVPTQPQLEEDPLPEHNDPEKLMQLLLDPAQTMIENTPLPQQSPVSQLQTEPQLETPPLTAPTIQVEPQSEVPVAQIAPQFNVPQVPTAPQIQATPQFIAPQIQAAPQFNAPQIQATPQFIAPQIQAAPQFNAPQIQATPQFIAPQIQAAPQFNAPQIQAAPQFNAPQVQAASQFILPQVQAASSLIAAPQQPQPVLKMNERPLVTPQPLQPQLLAGQVMSMDGTAPLQPLKLRTPKDAEAASKQIVTLMQSQLSEPLTKVLPSQLLVQTQQLLNVAHPVSQPSVSSQAPLKLPEALQEKATVLREALGERLQMQVDQRSQKATIRLDPPNLGKLDISLHYEGGKLQVQIQAAQPDVYRALQQVSQELRGTLIEQNQMAVNVQISQQQGEQRHAPQQQHTQEAVLSNNALNEVTEEQRHRDLSILTTV